MRPLLLAASCALALVAGPRVAAACDEEIDDPEVCAEDVAAFDDSFEEDVTFFERLELEVGNRMMRTLVIRRLDVFVVEFEEEDDLGPADDVDPDDPDFHPDLDDLPDDVDDELDEESEA